MRSPKLIVLAALIRQQLLMLSPLHKPSAVKHKYILTESAGGQAVADVYRSLAAYYRVEMGVHLRLGYRVEGGGGLV